MKKANSEMKTRLVARLAFVSSSLLGAIGFAACADTHVDPGSSGETHFLAVCTGECTVGLKCACQVCTADCSEDADCQRFGVAARCVTSCATAKKVCDAPCTSDQDCSALGSGFGCDSGRCRERIADSGVADHVDGDEKGQVGCTKPPSTCSVSDTCSLVGCGGGHYDAQGCERLPCTGDGDCGSDQRCAVVDDCNDLTCSTTSQGGCECHGGPVCGLAGYCNPIATAGPRGVWVIMDVVDDASDANDQRDELSRTWKVASDGGITRIDSGRHQDGGLLAATPPVSSVLKASDFQEVTSLANGATLRAELRDGAPCMSQPVFDESITVTLTLSTQTLSQGVTGCILGTTADGVFSRIYQIVSAY